MFKIKLSEVIKVWFSFIPKSKYHTSDIQTYQWMTEDLLAHSDDRVWFYKTRDSDLVPGPLRLQCQWHDIRLSECENLRRENFWITETFFRLSPPSLTPSEPRWISWRTWPGSGSWPASDSFTPLETILISLTCERFICIYFIFWHEISFTKGPPSKPKNANDALWMPLEITIRKV